MNMKAGHRAPATFDEYIAARPRDVRAILRRIRATIRKAAPRAQERISYRIPAFTLDGKNLVYFAAFTNHIGFYPAPVGVEAFKRSLATYECGRGSVRFPLDRPVPYALIARIVKFRARRSRAS